MEFIQKVFQNKHLVQRWGGRLAFGFLDQAVFSGANFIVSFLLARWLTESDYGAFSVAYSAFLFLAGIPTALIWEPMAVYGARYKEFLEEYIGYQLQYSLVFTVFIALISVTISLFLGEAIRQTFLFASISVPFVLLAWFLRQAAYLKASPQSAFLISLMYSFLYLCSLAVLNICGALSPGHAFSGMAVASFGGSIVGMKILKIPFVRKLEIRGNLLREDWIYGKFILVASVASSIASLAYLPMMGIFLGLAEAGAYRAMQNLILPLQQMVIAVALILLPQLSKIVEVQGEKTARRIVGFLLLLTTVLVLLYSILIGLWGTPVVVWLYQKPYYHAFTWLLPAMGGIFAVTAAAQLLGIAVRAFKKPQGVLWAKFAAAAIVLTFGIYATRQWQLNGVILSTLISAAAELLVLLWIYIRKQNA